MSRLKVLLLCATIAILSLPTLVQAEQVTIRVLLQSGETHESTHKRLIKAFEEQNPNVKILHEGVPFSELFRRIAVAVASDNPPDVIYVDGPMTRSYAYNRIIIPLDDYVEPEELLDFAPASIEECSFEGRLYALPERQSATAVFYNTDYTAAAGIQPPRTLEEAWTWWEMRDVLNKVTEKDRSGRVTLWGFTQRSKYTIYHDLSIIRSAGEPGSPTFLAISPDGKTVSGYLDSPEALEAMRFFQDLHHQDMVSPIQQTPDMFETGQSVFHQGPDNVVGRLDELYPDINWAVTPQPYFVTPIVHTGSFHFGVTAQSKHKDEAVEFIRFMTNPENSLESYKGIRQLPARLSVYNQIERYNDFPLNVFYESMIKWGEPRPTTPAFREYEEVFGNSFKDIVLGGDIDKIVADMVKRIDSELQKYF